MIFQNAYRFLALGSILCCAPTYQTTTHTGVGVPGVYAIHGKVVGTSCGQPQDLRDIWDLSGGGGLYRITDSQGTSVARLTGDVLSWIEGASHIKARVTASGMVGTLTATDCNGCSATYALRGRRMR